MFRQLGSRLAGVAHNAGDDTASFIVVFRDTFHRLD